MNLRFFLCIAFVTSWVSMDLGAQVSYYVSGSYQHLFFRNRTKVYDPTEGWLGYRVPDKTDGSHFVLVNGIKTSSGRFSTGLGLGYLALGPYDGMTIFSDNTVRLSSGGFTPIINGRLGYSHLWNQYPDGTGSFYGELNIGFQVKVWSDIKLSVTGGFMNTQEVKFIPVGIHLSF